MPAPFAIIYDEKFAAAARGLGKSVLIEAQPIDQLADGALGGIANALIWVDLRNLATVSAFRAKMGPTLPAPRSWVFFVETGLEFRAWQVQADALGATLLINRQNMRRHLRGLFSVAGGPALSAEKKASLERAVGGKSVAAAGEALSGLFGALLAREGLKTKEIAAAGASVSRDLAVVGADRWLATVRNHHEGTFQHCLLVSGVVGGYIERHVTSKADAARLMTAAMLHDIGKAAVPLHVLDKQGKLTEAEFAAIRAHPGIAYDYLVKQPGLDRLVLDAVRHHHEALDGSGYPDRLAGDEISELTRILTVCDVFAAMVEKRSYKEPSTPEEAISVLVKMAFTGKVDYAVVRRLAAVFGMNPPETLAEVEANMSAGGTAVARRPAAA